MTGEGMGMDEAMERGEAMRVPEDLRRAHVRDAEGPGPLARMGERLWAWAERKNAELRLLADPEYRERLSRETAAGAELDVEEMNSQDDDQEQEWQYSSEFLDPGYYFLPWNVYHDDPRHTDD